MQVVVNMNHEQTTGAAPFHLSLQTRGFIIVLIMAAVSKQLTDATDDDASGSMFCMSVLAKKATKDKH